MKTWLIFLAVLGAIGALTVADTIRKLNRPSIQRYAVDEKENERLVRLAEAYRTGGAGAQKERSITETCARWQESAPLKLCWEGFAVQKSLKALRRKENFEPPPAPEMAQAWYTGLGSAFSIAGLAVDDERAPTAEEFSWFVQGWAFDEFLRLGYSDAYMKCFTEFPLSQRPDCTLGIGRGAYFSRAQLLKTSSLPADVLSAYLKTQTQFHEDIK